MKGKPAITNEQAELRQQARNHIKQGAVTAAYSADRIKVLNSKGTPEAIPTSCGLDKLWGFTSNRR